jgi:hypothetical protein
LEEYSAALLAILEGIAREHSNRVSTRTLEFWRRATGGR